LIEANALPLSQTANRGAFYKVYML